MDKSNKRFWTITALAFVGILVWQITAGIMPALAKGAKALTPFLFAFVTAYLLRRPVGLLEKLFCKMQKGKRHKWQHTLATVLLLGVFFGLVVAAVIVIVPNVVNNITDLVVALPEFITDVKALLTKQLVDMSQWLDIDLNTVVLDYINGLSEKALMWVKNIDPQSVLFTATNIVAGTATAMMDIVLYVAASFFLLHDFDKMKLWIHEALRAFIKDEKPYNNVCEVLHTADVTMEKYIVVRLSTSLGLGIVCYIGFLLFRLPYSILLATIIAVTNIVPYIGPIVGALPAIIVALAAYDIKIAFWVTVFIVICQQIEGNVLTPLLTGDALNINPMLVLLGIAVFGAMMGIPGMILGAPIASVIAGVIRKAAAVAESGDKKENKNEIK